MSYASTVPRPGFAEYLRGSGTDRTLTLDYIGAAPLGPAVRRLEASMLKTGRRREFPWAPL